MANFLTMHRLYKIANSIKSCNQFYNTETLFNFCFNC